MRSLIVFGNNHNKQMQSSQQTLNIISLFQRMELTCSKAINKQFHELFTIGYLFGRFNLKKIEDFDFLYSCLGVLPDLTKQGLLTPDQKLQILQRMSSSKDSIRLPKPFELEINEYINICINDKLNGTNNFSRPPPPPKIATEDQSQRFIRELLEKERIDMIKKQRQADEAAKKIQEEEEMIYKSKIEQMSDKPLNMQCPICIDDIQLSDLGLLQCRHSFHRACLNRAFSIAIDDRKFPIKCPSAECGIEVNPADVAQFLSQQYLNKYETYTFEKYVDMHHEDMSWCPSAGCKYVFYFSEGDIEFVCPVCHKDYCLNCRADWHKGMTCKEFNIGRVFDKNDEKFIEFVKGAKYKQCPKCKFWVEKNEGCDHMTCRCGFQFCYVCGGVYQKCACTGAQGGLSVFVPGRQQPILLEGPRRPGRPMPAPRPPRRTCDLFGRKR